MQRCVIRCPLVLFNFLSIVFPYFFVINSFAYVEFADKESVENALALNDSLFKGRQIKVLLKISLNIVDFPKYLRL